MIGTILLCLLALLVFLLLICLVRTLLRGKKEFPATPAADATREKEYAEKLSEMVRFDTVSVADEPNPEKFREFHKVLEELYPTLFATLEKTEIDGNLLLYWKGKNSEKPLVLMSHQDVVAAEGEWKYPPFSGEIAEGNVWGRGSADIKCGVMTFMQAVEELLKEGYVPTQDVYLSCSCTEEVGGDGGPKLVAELERRGVKPYMVCDEGGAILEANLLGMDVRVAAIGVLEKGIANLKITARSNGGHASYPPVNSPLARIADFIYEMEHHSPFTCKMEPALAEMLDRFSCYGPFYVRYVLGNLWLFKPLVTLVMKKAGGQAKAMLRTTMAFTMAQGSEGYNVLPQEASVGVNMRFIPHQNMEESLRIVRETAAKYDLEVTLMTGNDHNNPVSTESEPFKLFEEVLGEVFPELPVIPYLMTGATDARFYDKICSSCIRFSPVVFGPAQMKGMHGLNECMSTACLPGAVDFYKKLILKNQ